jgi:hypothetical protein
VNDATLGGLTCETPCTTTAGCPNALTSCQTSLCQYNFCDQSLSGATLPGQYDGPCNAAGTGDGTCLPYSTSNPNTGAGIDFGLCSQAGSAASGASCGEARGAPLCTLTGICLQGANGGDSCSVICNPTAAAGACASPNICVSLDPINTAAGFCGPCVVSGGSCYVNGDCCSSSCNQNSGSCN